MEKVRYNFIELKFTYEIKYLVWVMDFFST